MFATKKLSLLKEEIDSHERELINLRSIASNCIFEYERATFFNPAYGSIKYTFDGSSMQGGLVKALRKSNLSIKHRPIKNGDDFEEELALHTTKLTERLLGGRVSYEQKIYEMCKALQLDTEGLDFHDVEKLLVETKFKQVWSSMNEDQRKAVIRSAREVTEKKGIEYKKELLAAGALGAAQLSGFGIYVAASTVLGAATGLLGVTLPFAAYTTLSSLISVAIGPVGWATLGAFAGFKFMSPRKKETDQLYLMLSAHRLLLAEDYEKERIELKKAIDAAQKDVGEKHEIIRDLENKYSALKQYNILVHCSIYLLVSFFILSVYYLLNF